MGNLRSVQKALTHLGFDAQITSSLGSASHAILPGVGAFGAAMAALNSSGLSADIRSFVASGGKLLCICLGQQLLFEVSDEFGETEGLGLLPGRVRYLPTDGVKVPHVGWNGLSFPNSSTLLAGISPGDQVYFVHSLYCDCAAPADVAAISHHGIPFAAAVQRDTVFGCQFHPEKSSTVGLRILQNFLES